MSQASGEIKYPSCTCSTKRRKNARCFLARLELAQERITGIGGQVGEMAGGFRDSGGVQFPPETPDNRPPDLPGRVSAVPEVGHDGPLQRAGVRIAGTIRSTAACSVFNCLSFSDM